MIMKNSSLVFNTILNPRQDLN